jgi:hypothetical protein
MYRKPPIKISVGRLGPVSVLITRWKQIHTLGAGYLMTRVGMFFHKRFVFYSRKAFDMKNASGPHAQAAIVNSKVRCLNIESLILMLKKINF